MLQLSVLIIFTNLTISWGKGGGGGRIGVGLEVKLFLQSFWISTIYAWLEALAHMFYNFNRL